MSEACELLDASTPGPVAVIGAGGHAKVVVSTLVAAGVRSIEIYDDRPELAGAQLLGWPVVGPTRLLSGSAGVAVLAVGSNVARRRLAEELGLRWGAVVHPRACVDPSVTIGAGAVVFAGCVIQPDAVLGEHCIVNTGATLDHDCRIGSYAHIAPGVHFSGNVRVGAGALVGVGACARPGVHIGAWATVGAGAVCVRDIPEGVTAVGVPARPLRLSPS